MLRAFAEDINAMVKVIASYALVAIAALIFYIAFIDSLSLILLITVILFPLVLLLSLLIIRAKTQISFFCEKSGENKGCDVNFNVRMYNPTFLPLPRVKISLHYENLLSGERSQAQFLFPLHFSRTQTLRFSISSRYCGKIEAVVDEVVFFDYLMLFRLGKKQKLQCSTVILPSICDADVLISEESEFSGEKDVYSKTHPGDDASEIFDMRDYEMGDRMSQIHWKLSSKQDNLIVKEYSKPVNSNVMLLFDFNSSEAFAADALADLLISLSYSMIERECEHFAAIYSMQDNALRFFDIDSSESCVVMAQTVMCTPAFEGAKALESYCENEFSRRYSHIIYACAQSSQVQSQLLEQLAMHTRVSAIVVDQSGFDGSKKPYMISDSAAVYTLQSGKIDALLSELVI